MNNILKYDDYILNESSIKHTKKVLRGGLNKSSMRHKMKHVLRDNIVTFKFEKRNGDIRRAKGTLHKDYLPPLRGGASKPEHQMVYFDLEKKGWRSFRSYTFIKILDIKPIESKAAKSKIVASKTKSAAAEEDEEEEVITTNTSSHGKSEDVENEHSEHSEKHHDEDDDKHKTFDKGEKMSEKELLRRSTDFRKGTKKNKLTHKANDKFKKGDLDDEED